ncbi:hypothetical protein DFQ27_008921 [Actinomortierella ambigua]|uniref:Ion transport domain-containing protein n=1 Tax=Actinomortierella ambigua TaxID=1343610 RepID=A0A9P6PRC2_9FUNG|nr:hypothetical protein DFQ27_008921 [Actinomortierella ambigua]
MADEEERTPSLLEQEEDAVQALEEQPPRASVESHESSASALVEDGRRAKKKIAESIRDVVQNQIPNGHHGSTMASTPRKIHALLPRLFALINSLAETSNIDEDEVVTDDVVEFLSGLGREVVYGLLRCVETYKDEGNHDVGSRRLMEARSRVAEVAATKVVKVFVDKDTMATYCQVVARPFYSEGESENTAENSLEIAIRVHATIFLADTEVQRCIQAMWTGLILQVEDESGQIRFVEYTGMRRLRKHWWDWIDVTRLSVPKYQNILKIAFYVIFLILYTYTVGDRKNYPTPVEWALYVFVVGYIFEEFRLFFEGGILFFLSNIWHWVNLISYSMFIVSFGFRMSAYLIDDPSNPTFKSYNDIAYDILAILAVFVWVKSLSILDGIQYFGTMVMVLQKMLKDGLMFFWLLAWVYIGFYQSFFALLDDELKEDTKISPLLLRGFLQDPDFDRAIEFHETYGYWLFALYLFLTSIILLNLLVALFNSSYTNITDSSEQEYLALYTFKVFSYLKSPDQFPFAAPTNLIEVFLLIPLSYILPRDTYRRLNHFVMRFLFIIPLLMIAYSEHRKYNHLRNLTDADAMSGGRREYRSLTNDATYGDVDDLFLLASQEFADELQRQEQRLREEADFDEAEEGLLPATSRADLWKNHHPSETYEDFCKRREKEKESKKRAVESEDLLGLGSSSSSGSGSGSDQSTQLLLRTLLAHIQRMEERQKHLEVMLQQQLALKAEDDDQIAPSDE